MPFFAVHREIPKACSVRAPDIFYVLPQRAETIRPSSSAALRSQIEPFIIFTTRSMDSPLQCQCFVPAQMKKTIKRQKTNNTQRTHLYAFIGSCTLNIARFCCWMCVCTGKREKSRSLKFHLHKTPCVHSVACKNNFETLLLLLERI